MIFDLGTAKAKVTLLDFNSYVLSERHADEDSEELFSENSCEIADSLTARSCQNEGSLTARSCQNEGSLTARNCQNEGSLAVEKLDDEALEIPQSLLKRAENEGYLHFCDCRPNILAMSFNAFEEIDLLNEANGDEFSRLRRLTQLSKDDDCTVFCGIRTLVGDDRALSVAVAHKGKLYDIVDRTINMGQDEYLSSDKLKIYNSEFGKIAVLIDTDGIHGHLWKKLQPSDFVLSFILDDEITSEVTNLAKLNNLPTIIISNTSATFIPA